MNEPTRNPIEFGDSYGAWFNGELGQRGWGSGHFLVEYERVNGPELMPDAGTIRRIRKGETKVPKPELAAGIANVLLTEDREDRYYAYNKWVESLRRRRDLASCTLPDPHELKQFIGRQSEIQKVAQLLARDDVRLVTLTAGPGVGKTRLGIEVARSLLSVFPEVYFIQLTESSGSDWLSKLARCVGVPDRQVAKSEEAPGSGEKKKVKQIKGHLSMMEKPMLVVLDNFENVLAGFPGEIGADDARLVEVRVLVRDLIAGDPLMKLLVTSRIPLYKSGDEKYHQEYHLLPLEVPERQQVLDENSIPITPAVELFVERAKQSDESFELTEERIPVVAEICRQLSGVPLAIELVAARVGEGKGKYKPDNLSAIIEDFRLLLVDHLLTKDSDAHSRTDARSRTMEATALWSYSQLTMDERTLFRWLSVFIGGCTVDAAKWVYQQAVQDLNVTTPALDVEEALQTLKSVSLLEQRQPEHDEGGFVMLHVLRECAQMWLGVKELEVVRRWYSRCFLDIAEKVAAEFHGSGQEELLARYDAEYENLLASLHWASNVRAVEHGLRLGTALGLPFEADNRFTEGAKWLALFIKLAEAAEREGQTYARPLAQAYIVAGKLLWRKGDLDSARGYFELSKSIGEKLGDRGIVAHSQLGMGLATKPGREKLDSLHLALNAFESLQRTYEYNVGYAFYHLGIVNDDPDQLDRSRQIAEQRHGDHWSSSHAYQQLGVLALRRAESYIKPSAYSDSQDALSNFDVARGHFKKALDAALERDKWLRGFAHLGLAWSLARLGEIGEVRVQLQKCKDLFDALRELWGKAHILVIGAIIADQNGNQRLADRLIKTFYTHRDLRHESVLAPKFPIEAFLRRGGKSGAEVLSFDEALQRVLEPQLDS